MSDTALQESVYIQYRDKVFSYIVSRINNYHDAEDLTSAVFVKVIASLDSYDSAKASMSTWIYTITQNCLRDYLRRNKTKGEHTGGDENLEIIPFIDDDVNGNSLILEEQTELLIKALEQLDERERDIIIMRYYNELEPKKIAEIMNISYANVRFLNHRAITKLRAVMSVE